MSMWVTDRVCSRLCTLMVNQRLSKCLTLEILRSSYICFGNLMSEWQLKHTFWVGQCLHTGCRKNWWTCSREPNISCQQWDNHYFFYTSIPNSIPLNLLSLSLITVWVYLNNCMEKVKQAKNMLWKWYIKVWSLSKIWLKVLMLLLYSLNDLNIMHSMWDKTQPIKYLLIGIN